MRLATLVPVFVVALSARLAVGSNMPVQPPLPQSQSQSQSQPSAATIFGQMAPQDQQKLIQQLWDPHVVVNQEVEFNSTTKQLLVHVLAQLTKISDCGNYPTDTKSPCYPDPKGSTPLSAAANLLATSNVRILGQYAIRLAHVAMLPPPPQQPRPAEVVYLETYLIEQALTTLYAAGQFPPKGNDVMTFTETVLNLLPGGHPSTVVPPPKPKLGQEYKFAKHVLSTVLTLPMCINYFKSPLPEVHALKAAIEKAKADISQLGGQTKPSSAGYSPTPPSPTATTGPTLAQIEPIAKTVLTAMNTAHKAYLAHPAPSTPPPQQHA